jgi:hypothetical protein
MNRLINSLKSLLAIISLNIKGASPHIVFYYPKHFNRGKNGENDFLKPLIDSCDRNNISYLIFEEPAKNAQKNKSAIPFDFLFYLILVFRKILPLKQFDHFEAREWRIGKILKSIFLSKVNPEIIITMSNSMLGFFRGWGNAISLYDYQHGIVYSWHSGYIINKMPALHIINNKSKIMLFGKGFKRLLTKDNDYYLNNCICVGTSMQLQSLHKEFNRKILLTLPITTLDELNHSQIDIITKLELLLLQNQSFYIEHDIVFYLKHHPRFDSSYDLASILSFPFIKVINGTLEDCFIECSLHLTHNSTTTFEAAVLGIPTLFIGNADGNLLYEEEFQYPKYQEHLDIQKKIEEFIIDPLSYDYAIELAQEWVKDYYEPFNECNFLGVINEKN